MLGVLDPRGQGDFGFSVFIGLWSLWNAGSLKYVRVQCLLLRSFRRGLARVSVRQLHSQGCSRLRATQPSVPYGVHCIHSAKIRIPAFPPCRQLSMDYSVIQATRNTGKAGCLHRQGLCFLMWKAQPSTSRKRTQNQFAKSMPSHPTRIHQKEPLKEP